MVDELHTPRLALRAWRDGDRDLFAALNADPVVMKWFPAALSRAESDLLVDVIEQGMAERGWGLWAVEVVGTGAFIGFVGLTPVPFDADFTPAVEVGWRLARAHWGHGYASEAARAALGYSFGRLGLARVVSFTAVGNRRSQAVMRRIGMTCVGEFDHPRVPMESPLRRHVLYAVDRAGAAAAGTA